ncbi:hypothetical protein CDD82_5040 [Ophiocordyceps australis]|uniref:Suppressor of forked domain-containing protein n=1 Tax=Ophiocordyceps australis TaxID=1399860 RepID=A0A2C5XJ31_9HYPO|nr:hypothetical protein CDD82_5040 [Ophiocordyceps australis]
MNDYGQFGSSDEEFVHVRKFQAEVESDPDNFESWEALVKASESLEGGLGRNSSPQALATFRESYDRFLAKFPLLFGYWKKYAELEFNIAGTESAEMVYERGTAAVTHSVDLWADYCRFKMDTTHNPGIVRGIRRGRHSLGARQPTHIREPHASVFDACHGRLFDASACLFHSCPSYACRMAPRRTLARNRLLATSFLALESLLLFLFERAAALVGIDFMSHPFWDRYLEYEERQEAPDRIFALLARIIRIPLHQFNRYYDRFRTMAHTRPVPELASVELLTRFRSDLDVEAAARGASDRTELERERELRNKVDQYYYEVHTTTQNETSKRWTFESELGRQYFHVTQLDHAQLNSWRKYLDFEEREGGYDRVVNLYERCLAACALYDELWFRYSRWMSAQQGREEEVRHIYMRAAFFVSISRPGIRLQWAYFEESQGRIGVAEEVHNAILTKLPDCIEVIVSWAHLKRRQDGLDAAITVLKDHIDAPTVDLFTKAALVAEWATILSKFASSADQARAVFVKNAQWYGDSRTFWEKWFQFEVEQPTSMESADAGQRVKHVFDESRSKSRLSTAVKKDLARIYLDFLIRVGGKDSMQEYAQVDRETFGPPSLSSESMNQLAAKENGMAGGELDEASKSKAESRLVFFYEKHSEPDATAHGPADFH